MSRVNLAVPAIRDKTPAPKVKATKKATGTKKTKDKAGPRGKSRSPNPSFCSVLSRVKDFENGEFTPKTALANNVLSPRYSNDSKLVCTTCTYHRPISYHSNSYIQLYTTTQLQKHQTLSNKN